MFNSDVTQTYNLQDATMEILIMLAGAFLLGALWSWLMSRFFSTEEKIQLDNTQSSEVQNLSSPSSLPQTNASRKVKIVSKTSEATYTTPRIDDLTKISGIDGDIQKLLKGKGIKSYTDLRDIDRDTLKQTFSSSTLKKSNQKELETWPHQASLAAKGEWKKLSEYQAFIKRAKTASQNTVTPISRDTDDLKRIEGIGPRIEEILNNNGITTFKQLRKTDSETLKSYITKDDKRFKNNETESWPHQAGMAEKGQWEELSIYQEFMDDSDDNDQLSSSAISKIGSLPPVDKSKVNEKDDLFQTDAQKIAAEIENKKYDQMDQQTSKNDLKLIEGIGPKIEEVLNKNGIATYKQLRKTNRETLKSFLDKAGSQFQMHEPETWPHQAGMAERGEWEELKKYQEFMDGGREFPSASASTKLGLASLHVNNVTKTQANKDDLKKIEGIGPKIEKLLYNAGINTFKDLKDSNRNQLKEILQKAGPQYSMHEPETWPLQARMAFEGEWQKLNEYQDFLMGGRE